MLQVDHTGVQPGAVLAVDYFSQVHSHVILSTHEIIDTKKNDVTLHWWQMVENCMMHASTVILIILNRPTFRVFGSLNYHCAM